MKRKYISQTVRCLNVRREFAWLQMYMKWFKTLVKNATHCI